MPTKRGRWPELSRFRRLGLRADAWALSSESSMAGELFATVASAGSETFEGLQLAVANRDLNGWDAFWVARLARVLVLQPSAHRHHEFAFNALCVSVPLLPRNRQTLYLRKLFFEVLFSRSLFEEAREQLASDSELKTMYHGYLEADLLNPCVGDGEADVRVWLEAFNRPLAAVGIQPISVVQRAATPFDGLTAEVDRLNSESPLVSVILTTYNPDIVELRTSLTSILNQRWSNLEVLLVDDCSDVDSYESIRNLSKIDNRIRLIRAETNGGTYRARNLGISHALGDYITGQDTDDWSHPQRIDRQVAYLENNPESIGVTIAANRTDNNLLRTSLGHNPERRCEVSLMVRRSTAVHVGGYLPVRKAADSEFRERIEVVFNKVVDRIDEPLYMIRMSPGSLSRADFRPGWAHHARRGFWGAYKHWHRNATVSSLQVDQSTPPFEVTSAAPSRIAGKEWSRSNHYNVCIVADWRGADAVHRTALDELLALLDSDLRISILHLDIPWVGVKESRALNNDVQKLLNGGLVDRVYLDDDVEADLLLVRDPAALDYASRTRAGMAVKRIVMVGHGTSKDSPYEKRPYDEMNADSMARVIFGIQPVWVLPEFLDSRLGQGDDGLKLSNVRYPNFFNLSRWDSQRLLRGGVNRTVVGRFATNEVDDWPSKKILRSVYPVDGSVDIRVLGDARGAVRELGKRYLPGDWLQYRVGEIEPVQFWNTVDICVHFERTTAVQGIERPILESLASGTPVVTDKARGQLYGDAVIGVDPRCAMDSVRTIMSDQNRIKQLSRAGQEFVGRFSDPAVYRSFISKQLALGCGVEEYHE